MNCRQVLPSAQAMNVAGWLEGMAVACIRDRASVGNGCRVAMDGLNVSRIQATAVPLIRAKVPNQI